MSYRGNLAHVVRTVVEPAAQAADDGRFPRAAVQALADAGVLGLTMPRAVGGGAGGLVEAGHVVERVARSCASTATVLQAHFAAVVALDRLGDRALRAEVAAGGHLGTLAVFGPDFLGPTGTAVRRGHVVDLRDRKREVVSAGEADSYLWSSPPLSGRGSTSLWLVPGNAPGLLVPAVRRGIGLRGNASTTVWADPVQVPEECLLGADGHALDVLAHHVLPWYLVLGAAVGLGIMEGVISALPGCSADLARMRLRADAVRVLRDDAVAALDWEPDRARRKLGQLVLVGAEALLAVTDLAMEVGGPQAELGVERRFRDARAVCARAPGVDAVVEFVARTAMGLPAATPLGA